jgi:hypothetical protein
METAMILDVHRHSDGSIDFDFYRTRAATLRRQALRDMATQRIAPMGARVMAGALGFAVVIPSVVDTVRD